jgi:hypothetical protein
MSTISTFFHVLDGVITYTWPIIFSLSLYLHHVERHRRRLERGKFSKWKYRTFGGPYADWHFFLYCEFPALVVLLGSALTINSRWPAHLWWIYIGVRDAVDWITGSDDPPYRRWLASLSDAVKKLKIEPPPRPVIERA